MTSWTVAQWTPLSLGFPRQAKWSGLLFPSPGDLPDPGIKPGSPALQADSLPSEPPGQAFVVVQLLSRVWHSLWPHGLQHTFTISQSLFKLMSIESVMPSNRLILCCPLLLPPSIFPRNRIFSSESVLRIRWPKFWSFSFRISPSNEYSGLIAFRFDWFDLLAVWDSQESSPKLQFKSINSALSFLYGPNLTSIHDYWKNHSFD